MLERDERPGDGECSVTGHVRDVVYLGANTRYTVDLDPGGELVVLQQNLARSSMEALEVRGKRVRLAWDRLHSRTLARSEEGTGPPGPGEEGT